MSSGNERDIDALIARHVRSGAPDEPAPAGMGGRLQRLASALGKAHDALNHPTPVLGLLLAFAACVRLGSVV